jgi:transcriptional regulator with PAS, ATPase and Fis domain
MPFGGIVREQAVADATARLQREVAYFGSIYDIANMLYRTKHAPTLKTIKLACAFNQAHDNRWNALIEGPSGTGKELIARICSCELKPGAMHTFNIKAVNVSGLTHTLFESQLFGYVGGAFTGALKSGSAGFFRDAGHGVAFLDEVGDLPLDQQAKLLRVLAERTVTPVGGTAAYPLDCKFVFATNKNLEDMVSRGLFREDLYARIAQLRLSTYSIFERGQEECDYITDEIIAKEMFTPRRYDNFQILADATKVGNVRAIINILVQRHYETAARG